MGGVNGKWWVPEGSMGEDNRGGGGVIVVEKRLEYEEWWWHGESSDVYIQ